MSRTDGSGELASPLGILETCLYTEDLGAAAGFYEDVIGLELVSSGEGRHVFFRSGQGMLLLFDPRRTSAAGGEVPAHGAVGPGHVAFAVPASDLHHWSGRLSRAGVEIERKVVWPRGGVSIYVRDPAGNSVELTSTSIWGIPEEESSGGASPEAQAGQSGVCGRPTSSWSVSMPTRKASAIWEGGLKGGSGTFEGVTGAVSGKYTAGSRFAEDQGSNPEELLAAAHAACFSMALSAQLEGAGHAPESVRTEAACTVEKVGDGFTITKMKLTARAKVPGLDDDTFQTIANGAKEGCPVSRALAALDIQLDAALV